MIQPFESKITPEPMPVDGTWPNGSFGFPAAPDEVIVTIAGETLAAATVIADWSLTVAGCVAVTVCAATAAGGGGGPERAVRPNRGKRRRDQRCGNHHPDQAAATSVATGGRGRDPIAGRALRARRLEPALGGGPSHLLGVHLGRCPRRAAIGCRRIGCRRVGGRIRGRVGWTPRRRDRCCRDGVGCPVEGIAHWWDGSR